MINYKREYKGVEGGPIDVNTLDRKKKKKNPKTTERVSKSEVMRSRPYKSCSKANMYKLL